MAERQNSYVYLIRKNVKIKKFNFVQKDLLSQCWNQLMNAGYIFTITVTEKEKEKSDECFSFNSPIFEASNLMINRPKDLGFL